MAIANVGDGGYNSASAVAGSASVALAFPAGTANGNAVIAAVCGQTSSTTIAPVVSTPTGWTLLGSVLGVQFGSGNTKLYLFGAIKTAGLTGTFAGSSLGTGGIDGNIRELSGTGATVGTAFGNVTTVSPTGIATTDIPGPSGFTSGQWNYWVGINYVNDTVNSTSPVLSNVFFAAGVFESFEIGTTAPGSAPGTETITWSTSGNFPGIGVTVLPATANWVSSVTTIDSSARIKNQPYFLNKLVPISEVTFPPHIPPVLPPSNPPWHQPYDVQPPRFKPFWFRNLVPPTEVTFAPPTPPVPTPKTPPWDQPYDVRPPWFKPFWFRNLVPPTDVTWAPPIPPVTPPTSFGWQQQFDRRFQYLYAASQSELTFVVPPVSAPAPTLGWQQQADRRYQVRYGGPQTELAHAPIIAPVITPTGLWWQQQFETPVRYWRYQFRNAPATEVVQAITIPPVPPPSTLGWQQQFDRRPPVRYSGLPGEVTQAPIPAPTITPSSLGWQQQFDRWTPFRFVVPATETAFVPVPAAPVQPTLGWQPLHDTRPMPSKLSRALPSEITWVPSPAVPTLGWQQQFDQPFRSWKLQLGSTETVNVPVIPAAGTLGWQIWTDRPSFELFTKQLRAPTSEAVLTPVVLAPPVVTPGPLGWQVWNDKWPYLLFGAKLFAATADITNSLSQPGFFPPPPPPPPTVPLDNLVAAYLRRMKQDIRNRADVLWEDIRQSDFEADQALDALIQAAALGDQLSTGTLDGIRDAVGALAAKGLTSKVEDGVSQVVTGTIDWRTIWR